MVRDDRFDPRNDDGVDRRRAHHHHDRVLANGDAGRPATRLASADAPDGELETGTTTLAAAGTDGAVLAADARASVGGGRFVRNRDVRKVVPISDRAAITFAGSVSDAQSFARTLRAEKRLYALRHDGSPSLETLATAAGDLLRRGPYRALKVLLAGVEDGAITETNDKATTDANGVAATDANGATATDANGGPAVYDVGRGGGVMRTDYAATGSGMQLAYGVLEDGYDSNATVDGLRSLAATAVESASARDTASGDGMTVATVTAEGVDVARFDGLGVDALRDAADRAGAGSDDEEVA